MTGACRTPKVTPASQVLDDRAAPSDRRTLQHYQCPEDGKVKVAFFDADSTLRVSRSGSLYPSRPDDVYLLPFVAEKITELSSAGYLVAIASNQGAVPRSLPYSVAHAAILETARKIHELGGTINFVDFATKCEGEQLTHERCDVDPDEIGDDGANYRKPNTGMAQNLERALATACPDAEIDKSESFMVGDAGYSSRARETHPDGRPGDDFSNSDRGFAENYEIEFHEPTDFFGWREFGIFNFHRPYQLIGFIAAIEAEAADINLRGNNRTRATRLDQEAAMLGRVNSLPDSHTYVHYNIRELKTSVLLDENDEQLKAAADTINLFSPQFLSINELQYDKPDTPTAGLPGTGQNIQRLLQRLGHNPEDWQVTFGEPLTGRLARGRQSDNVNFGRFPGEYGTAFAAQRHTIAARTIHPVVPENIDAPISDEERILWQDWDPEIDTTAFRMATRNEAGETVYVPYPTDTVWHLFDKNFNHSTIEMSGRPVHFINFHTVPSFGFGNPHTPNLVRNQAQLAFLEWYLLGKCDPDSPSRVQRCETKARPLRESERNPYFIVSGDLNVGLDTDKPGAAVLKRILFQSRKVYSFKPYLLDTDAQKNPRTQISHVTYMKRGIDLGQLQDQLDYFLVSKDICLDALFPYAPKSFYREVECFPIADEESAEAARARFATANPNLHTAVSKRYSDGQACVVAVSQAFANYRKGSDHLPMILKFHFRNENDRCD